MFNFNVTRMMAMVYGMASQDHINVDGHGAYKEGTRCRYKPPRPLNRKKRKSSRKAQRDARKLNRSK